MKFFVLLSLLICSNAFATKAPFDPWISKLTGDLTINGSGVTAIGSEKLTEDMMADDAADGVNVARIARATYDVAVDGGTATAHGLGVTLPANALITRSWLYTVTQFTDAGSGTVAISCEDANNIYSAADITGITAGTNTTGVQDDAIANFTGSIAADCEITATVATAAQTAGKLIVFVEYVIVE